MSYLNKQIRTILELHGIEAVGMVGVGIGAGLLAYKGLQKYFNKITCSEPNWSNYKEQMNIAIRQSKRENNTKVVNILKEQLKKDEERCNEINK